MVTISVRCLVAVSVWLPAVLAAGLGAEQPIPGGPIQTAAPNLKEAASATPRAVTAHPHARGLLQKRDTRTCGYVDGNSMLAYVCANSAAQCLYNTVASAVGCCLTTSCNIYTACLPYSSSAATATLDMDRTRYCSDSASPYCAVLSYADPTNSLSGYTIPTCDSVPTTYKFYFSSLSASSPTTRSSSSSSRSSLSLTRASSSSDASSTGDADETQSNPATSSTAAPGPVTSSGSSTPVGPIVGGVVGGVAALGLIGLGIFFLVRRKNQTPTTPPPPPPPAVAAAAAPPPGPAPAPFNSPLPAPYSNQKPPLDMGLAPGAAPVFDPRYSVAPSMSSPATVSPLGSPMPGYPALGIATPPPQGYSPPPPQGYAPQGYAPQGYAPPPQYAPQNTQFAPYPGQQMQPPPQQQQQQQYHSVAELPAQRGDGQVHELS